MSMGRSNNTIRVPRNHHSNIPLFRNRMTSRRAIPRHPRCNPMFPTCSPRHQTLIDLQRNYHLTAVALLCIRIPSCPLPTTALPRIQRTSQ
jgi:hypothetical protein